MKLIKNATYLKNCIFKTGRHIGILLSTKSLAVNGSSYGIMDRFFVFVGSRNKTSWLYATETTRKALFTW